MGLFTRIKRAAKSKANSALDKAIDPAREVDMAINELDEQHKAAIKELLSYKTTAKQMEGDIAKQEERASGFEKKAMLAVKAGNDELAKECLAEKKRALIERDKIARDRDEAAGYAIELNRSRKKFDVRLKMLKLKKGTMATQIASARSAGTNAFGFDDSAFTRLAEAEDRIEGDAIAAEVQAAMDGDEMVAAELEARLLSAESEVGPPDADAALAAMKAELVAEKAPKKLGSGDD